MPYSAITCRQSDHVVTITLDRPGTGNTVDARMAAELEEACLSVSADDAIRAVIITGAGEAFCRGNEAEQGGEAASYPGAAAAVALIEQPVIAAINGDALGQGLEIALACDVRLAARRARLGFPAVGRGLMPADGGTQRLPRLVGRGKALELLFTGDTITAGEALDIGLVGRVVDDGALMREAAELAAALAAKAPLALRFIKEAVAKGLDLTLPQGLRLEADLYFLLHTTADRTEGIRAFLEKRPPRFTGE